MKNLLPRRRLLRGMMGGALTYVGLPLLEGMLHRNGTALANGEPLPKRYGQFYWGAGTDSATFAPLSEGANWQPSFSLEPLNKLIGDISVVSGVEVKFRGPTGHQEGHAAMLAGAWNGNNVDPNVVAVAGPTLDQVLVQALAPKTPYASIQVASSQVGYANYTAQSAVSWLNSNTPNSLEFSPYRFYDTLFGTSGQQQQGLLERKSVLDVVYEELQAFQRNLGAADKQRLEAHAQGIRQLEMNLAAAQQNLCAPPTKPAPDEPFVESKEQVRLKHRLFVDMLAIALGCDMTRIFSVQYTGYKGDTVFWEINAPFGYHATTHFSPGRNVQLAVRYIMEDFAYLVDTFKKTPDGASNLLDSSCIYATSDLADGFGHTTLGMPVLLAGKAGGALTSGLHLMPQDKPNASNVLLTILQAMGVPATSFGVGPGYTEQVIAGLLSGTSTKP